MQRKERRKNPRVRICDPIAFLSMDSDVKASHHNVAIVFDVSKSGIRIETFQPISSEDIILMFFDLDQKQIEVRGAVIYCAKNDCGLYNVGINLAGTDGQNMDFVKALVKSYHYTKNTSHLPIISDLKN
ncbi:MAG: PilZ domain-containing protein [Desulfobacterales bacterium]